MPLTLEFCASLIRVRNVDHMKSYKLTALDQEILDNIGKAEFSTVADLHGKIATTCHFVELMRAVHNLHSRGFLFQQHRGYEGIYGLRPNGERFLRAKYQYSVSRGKRPDKIDG